MLAHACILLAIALSLWTPNVLLQTSFAAEQEKGEHEYTVLVEDKPYTVIYDISGGTVESMNAESHTRNLTVRIDADFDGKLKLAFPGSFLSKVFGIASPGEPPEMVVFVDEFEVAAVNRIYDCHSTLEIPFEEGSEQIDIVGPLILIMPLPEGNSFTTTITTENKAVQLPISTNADTCAFSLVKEQKKLHVDVAGPKNDQGLFTVAVPHYFLGGDYAVMVNGNPIEFESTFSNSTGEDFTTISFSYEDNTTRSIDIIGTSVIPEFGTIAIVIIAISIAGILFVNRSRR